MKMGAGKSSTILPLLSLSILNSGQLVVVVVPDPLMVMSERMTSRAINGVFGRRVSHFKFSRYTMFGSPRDMLLEADKILSKLELAVQLRSVVLATSSSLKAFVLSFVEA